MSDNPSKTSLATGVSSPSEPAAVAGGGEPGGGGSGAGGPSSALRVAGPEGARRDEGRDRVSEAGWSGRRWRRTSRWLGLAIFVAGAVLLAIVFWKAWHQLAHYADPGYLNGQFNLVNDESQPSIQRVLQAGMAILGSALLQLLYLLLLGYLAAMMATRGIQFFAASEAVIDEAVVPDHSPGSTWK